MLKQNDYMYELNLENNGISDRGAKIIFDALEENITLENLNLNKNNLTKLFDFHNIKKLSLDQNIIQTESLKSLAPILKKREITHLSLQKNPFHHYGLWRLLSVVPEHPTLRELDIRFCKIPKSVCVNISRKTKSLRTHVMVERKTNDVDDFVNY